MNPRGNDPLDSVVPAEARWEAFRRQFAAAHLLQWLLAELEEIAPDYPRELHERLEQAFLDYPQVLAADGEYDGWVPVRGPGDSLRSAVWMLEEDAASLHEMLFPHGPREADLATTGRSMALVAIHGALELYALGASASLRAGLPKGLRELLTRRGLAGRIDSHTFEALVELDATRHIIVHNASIVDESYIRATHSSKLLEGERRTITSDDLHRFGDAARRLAELLRESDR